MKLPVFNRSIIIQGLTVLLIMLPLAIVGWYVWAEHQRLQIHLAELAPRYARLAGLVEHQADLKTLEKQANEQLARTAYPAKQDLTQAGNDAQQRIRSLFADSKLDIVSVQVVPPGKDDAKFDRIQIALRVEGELVGIQNALALLAAQTPVVLVDSMTLQTIGAVKPASVQRLSGQFSFSVLRVRT